MNLHSKLGLHVQSADSLDGVDRILLAELAAGQVSPARVAVVDAVSAAIFDELAGLFPSAQLVAYNDSLVAEREVDAAAEVADWAGRFERVAAVQGARFPAALFDGVGVVLLRLPKSLDYLDEFACAASLGLSQSAVLLAAERTKYMTPTQNSVLGKYFGGVSASLGRFKSRVLRATSPMPAVELTKFPKRAVLPELGLEVVAHGGVFAGTKLDIGSRHLVENFGVLLAGAPDALDFVDAGCGSGILAARVAQLRDLARVTAVDVSAAAVLSTRETALANGFSDRIVAMQDNALAGLPAASADVVVCNPPFHTGTALDTDVPLRMFQNAGRILRPGGQLWTVYNSPLPYKATMTRVVGYTRAIASNRKFVVTVSTKE